MASELEMERPPSSSSSMLTHEDNRHFLRMLREEKERLGVAEEKVEVTFEDLVVEADVRIGHRTLPTLLNCVVNTAQELATYFGMCTTMKRPIKIIKGVSGNFKPSRMTLLLGAPGSGKTTFLKALVGNLDPSLKLKGKLMYNGKEVNPSTPLYQRAYISQYDLHHAEMTVRETIDFSSKMLGTNGEFEVLRQAVIRKHGDISKEDKDLDSVFKASSVGEGSSNLTTNYIIKILGLSDCADTLVGDEMRRGISGGQKKRVTIGEMLVGLARCFFMDDISTGLDSSTTYEIIKFLQEMTHLMDLTMVISLLQPTPETLELFDDIILLCEGQIVYHGPREDATHFFETMGFKCPDRKNVADFLQEVTSVMDQKQHWGGDKRIYQYCSNEKIAESFRSSYMPQLVQENQLVPNNNTVKSESIKARSSLSRWNVFKACFSREVLLLKRNSPVHIFMTVQLTLLAFVISTLFLRTTMKQKSVLDTSKYFGALFIAVMIVNFNGMVEITMTVKRLPTFYKQRELLALPGWALIIPVFLISIPISLLQTGLWTILTYYVIGYAPSFIRFMKHYLVLFAIHQMSMGMCRLLAALARTLVMANVLSTPTLIAIFIFGGTVISKDDLQPWLRWGYWISPFTYAQNAVCINEFLDRRWAKEFHYKNDNTLGDATLEMRGMLTEGYWYWISVGILFGFSLVFNILSIFTLEVMNSPHKHQANFNATKTMTRCTYNKVGTSKEIDDLVFPFRPLSLTFDHINYFVDMPKDMMKYGVTEKKLQLLRDVSGAFRPGILTCLMGITGAGKTTLLDVLAGRKTGGYIEGTIRVAGYPKKQETFSRIAGYCEQTDIHSPNLTVYESLQFSAQLRLPSNIGSRQRDMFIDQVMDLVELTGLKNMMVGLAGATGLSAEQRKRLTIAVELVASPSIIFMDEPTTGLDARAAAIVMRTVRNTVDTGRTVVCTIHQPNIEIFESFDELLLMKKGGQIIYSGSLGSLSRNMIQYFEAIPGVPKIKEGQNPAAWMLDISSHTIEHEIGVDYAHIYTNSSLYRENMLLVDDLGEPAANTNDLHFPPRYWPNFRAQCMACLWKQSRAYWKNPEHNVVRFLNTFILAIMFGIVFWQTGSTIKYQQDIFNILGLIYGSALFLGFNNCCIIQPVVAMERVVLYREKAAGTYSTSAYAIAQVAIELPYMLVQVFMFASIVYPMIGFQMTVDKFFWFLLYMVLSYMYYTLFGMMTVALTPNVEIASGLSFLIFIFWNIFSGFIIGREFIPVWWRWVYWANPSAWTVYGLMFSQLGDRTELILVPGQPDQTVREFLEGYLGLEDRYFNFVTCLHVVIIALFTFLFFFFLKHLNFQRR